MFVDIGELARKFGFETASGPMLLGVRHISSANPGPGDTTEIVMANGASFEVKLPYKDVASRIKELGRG